MDIALRYLPENYEIRRNLEPLIKQMPEHEQGSEQISNGTNVLMEHVSPYEKFQPDVPG